MAECRFFLNSVWQGQYNYLFQIHCVIILTTHVVTVLDKCKATYAGQIIQSVEDISVHILKDTFQSKDRISSLQRDLAVYGS